MHTANSIPLTAVKSSQLAAIGHCPKTETLAIQFLRKGAPDCVYHYKNFTAQEFTAFASAESVGSHFYKHIKPHADKHPYTNMGVPEASAPAAASLSKELLAMVLNGRQRDDEITPEVAAQAKAAGLLIVYGGNDMVVFAGAMSREVVTLPGERVLLSDAPASPSIEVLWCAEEDCSWTYRTTVPHATFEIMDGDLAYCRGIVINMADLGGVAP